MMHRYDLAALLRRYYPVFIFSNFMTIFSIVAATSLATRTWVQHVEDKASYSVMFLMAASLILCFGFFLIVRGRKWGVWLVVGLLLASLLAVLATYPWYGARVNLTVYTLGILFPLLGLLSLNSRRSREMCEQFAVSRAERLASRAELHRRNVLEQQREGLRKTRLQRKNSGHR